MHGRTTYHQQDAPHVERVCALVLEIVERLPVPAAAALGSAAVADVRADAAVAAWQAAARNPHAFAAADDGVDRARVAGYLRKALLRALDELARERRRRQAARRAAGAASATTVLDAVLDREDERELAAALASLPAGQRAVVERRMRGWSFARIGTDLGIRRNTAVQRYRRARLALPAHARRLLPSAHTPGR